MSVTVTYSNVSATLDMSHPEMNLTPAISVNNSGSDEEKRLLFESYTLYVVTYYIDICGLYVIAAFGVPGNVASIFTIVTLPTVSSSKVSDTKLEVHVAILAVTDTLAILLKILYRELSAHGIYTSVPGHALIMFLIEFLTVYANWIVVAMTAERFLAVCFPLRVGRIYTRRKAVIVLAVLALITAGLYVFHFWVWEEAHDSGFWWYQLKEEHKWFVLDVSFYVSGCYYVLMPCALIFTGNVLIIVSIRQAREPSATSRTPSTREGARPRTRSRLRFAWSFIFHLSSLSMISSNSMSSFRRRFLDSIRCRGRVRHRHTRSSVYRTSQTYLHSVHQTGGGGGDVIGRPDGISYSAFSKRSSARVDSGHSLKLCANGGGSISNNNKIGRSLLKQDSQRLNMTTSDL
ncbi:hypothetical protein Btru_070880 [Bulinus truncatus]|nr:hypothetical protein Btru_070880 [Bulinus truncatus]